MCRTHEAVSALAWLAVAAVGMVRPSVGQLAVGAVVAAGSGILPDFDHPCAAPSHCLPPMSRWLARWVGRRAGGHRQRTHTLLAAAVVAAVVWGAAHTVAGRLTVLALCMLLVWRVLHPGSLLGLAALAGAVAAAVYIPLGSWLWAPVTVGYVAHLLGDCLSVEGVPLLWPATRFRFKLPLVPVDSVREHVLGGVASVTVVWMLVSGCGPALGRLVG